MTISQFKVLIRNGNLNTTNKPFVVNLQGNTILGIAVEIARFNILQLQQATSITLGKIPGTGLSSYTISVENRQGSLARVDKEIVGAYFVYSFINNPPSFEGTVNYQPATGPDGNPTGFLTEEYNSTILIEPGESTLKIESSAYQVLQNNASTSRNSSYIKISDRKESTLNPLNIQNILSGSANPALAQDSNYTTTGWVNSRYEGSITSRENYGGIDAVLLVKSFEGSYFTVDTADTAIQNQDTGERSYESYIHTGIALLPSYELVAANFTLSNSIDAVSTVFTLTSNILRETLNVGDILQVTVNSRKEYIKILKILSEDSNTGTYQVEAIRGWNNSTTQNYTTSATFKKIKPVNIYEVEGNKPASVKEGKIRVKETGEILYIDRFGTVLFGISSPQP